MKNQDANLPRKGRKASELALIFVLRLWQRQRAHEDPVEPYPYSIFLPRSKVEGFIYNPSLTSWQR